MSTKRAALESLQDAKKFARQGFELHRDPQIVLQSFNTWAFKRQQPTEPELLLHSVISSVSRSEPISFVLYWGKGPRSGIGVPEKMCLHYLAQMTQRIRCAYPQGARITLIMTDTHAEHNGYSPSRIAQYYAEVALAASEHNYRSVSLRSIVEAGRCRIRAELETPSAAILEKLEPCAAKWYRGQNTIANGAEDYFRMNMLEKRAVELAYPGSIFITFNSSEYRELFPSALPVFYMYSMRKGNSVKPWFVDVEQSRSRTAGTADDPESSTPQL